MLGLGHNGPGMKDKESAHLHLLLPAEECLRGRLSLSKVPLQSAVLVSKAPKRAT